MEQPSKNNPYGRVYLITNLINGKYYVGVTKRKLTTRWNQHVRTTSCCRRLKHAIQKHGRDNFNMEELTTAESQEQLNQLETLWIIATDSMNPEFRQANVDRQKQYLIDNPEGAAERKRRSAIAVATPEARKANSDRTKLRWFNKKVTRLLESQLGRLDWSPERFTKAA